MSSKQSSGGPGTPDDILNTYLDDLLGGEDPLGAALDALNHEVTPIAANAGAARVVPLPTKKNSDKTPDKPTAERGTKPAALPLAVARQAPEPTTSYPEPVQSQEQKLKLEKLLLSARTQLLTDTPVVSPATKTRFVEDPNEIQDWTIDVPVIAPESPVDMDSQQEQQRHPAGYQVEGLEWLENGRPQWAQSRFDVLLFQVSGLTLAVPLIALGQIQPLTDELTPLFGQADWFMGLQPTPGGKIRTVNTAKFVMPERYDESFLETARYVVSINGVPWGLAVDSVNQPITLQPEDVKWRGDRSKRPWLAGTVKEHMCALLDIPRIGQMLIDADKNFVPA